MSELRRHLERARDAHRGATYPGDLAAELIAPPLARRRVFVQVATVVAAAAAVVVLAVRLSQSPVHIEPPADLIAQHDPVSGAFALTFPALDVPEPPTLAIETPSLTFPVPAFPSWQSIPSATSTTRESV